MSSDDDFLGPVNIGNPNEFSILSLAEKVVSKTNSKSKIVFKRLPKMTPSSSNWTFLWPNHSLVGSLEQI